MDDGTRGKWSASGRSWTIACRISSIANFEVWQIYQMTPIPSKPWHSVAYDLIIRFWQQNTTAHQNTQSHGIDRDVTRRWLKCVDDHVASVYCGLHVLNLPPLCWFATHSVQVWHQPNMHKHKIPDRYVSDMMPFWPEGRVPSEPWCYCVGPQILVACCW